MKTQHRKFIVEFKSARRRSSMPDSIWGNTDLKAHVREAEAEAPHLFESNASPEPIGEDTAFPADAGHQNPSNVEKRADSDEEVSVPMVESSEQIYPTQHAGSSPFNSIVVSRSNNGDSKRVKKRSTTSAKRRGDSVNATFQANPVHFDVGALSEELAVLEIENQRLRRLLAGKLRLENVELRRMLARFEVTESLRKRH